MRRRVLVTGLVVLALVSLLVAGRALWQRFDRTPFQAALGTVDGAALRVAFTDWKQVRADLEVLAMDRLDELRVRKVELVEAAVHHHSLGVETGAHRTVADQRGAGQALAELVALHTCSCAGLSDSLNPRMLLPTLSERSSICPARMRLACP